MYAGEEKLKLGLDRLNKAADDSDLLSAALISLHGALEDRFRHALASTPELPTSEQKRALDVTKVQWVELIDMMRLYRGLSAEDAAQIQKMNRARQSVAHGDRYRGGRAALERYATLVQSFFPGLDLSALPSQALPPGPSPQKPQPPRKQPAQEATQPKSRPSPATNPKAAAKVNPPQKGAAAQATAGQKAAAPQATARRKAASPVATSKSQEPARRRSNPALFLILGLLFIIACVGLSTLLQGSLPSTGTATPGSIATIVSQPDQNTNKQRRTSESLNLRIAPGIEASIIATLAPGSSVELLSEAQSQDGRRWVRVRFGSQEGWVDSQYLR